MSNSIPRSVSVRRAEDEIDTRCGSLQELTASSGEFSSGNYPSSYDNGMSCSWHITVLHTLRVCSSPGTYRVSNNMSLSFQSDARLADRSFSATWEAVYPVDLVGKISQLICDGQPLLSLMAPNLTYDVLQISRDVEVSHRRRQASSKSQNWPMHYPANSMCLWTIHIPKGKTIKLMFTHFDVEEAGILFGQCNDNVVVYDGTQPGAKNTVSKDVIECVFKGACL
ncbi:hypothetical protein cypCar_00026050 [Cyprinus carpio]|nr:hypothetical protein cypCar_00026050 [Cyprinus carpio]